jgi:hypothetical protein
VTNATSNNFSNKKQQQLSSNGMIFSFPKQVGKLSCCALYVIAFASCQGMHYFLTILSFKNNKLQTVVQ